MSAAVHVRRRAHAPPPPLDASQAAACAAVAGGGRHLVVGAPGSGKTTVAAHLIVTDVERGGTPLLLVPDRLAAARLRNEITRRLGRTTTEPLVRTPAALAYAILRLRAGHLGAVAPTLITGPEQDRVLAELLTGHTAGEGPALDWPANIGPQTWQLQAFRAELRDVLMRAAEAGLDGAGLTAWGQRHQRPEWVGAGQILTEYNQVTALGQITPDRGARYDAATIVDEAVAALQSWEEDLPGVPRPQWSLVVHDDYQDATLATARLLDAVGTDGAQLVVTGDPDAAVQSFRGGVPALVATAALPAGGQDGAWGAEEHTLSQVWRHGPDLREPIQRLTQGLPVLTAGARRRAPGRAEDAPPSQGPAAGSGTAGIDLPRGFIPAVLASPAQEVAFIARELRQARLHAGVPWSQMAVIARSGAQLGAIRRGLRAAQVPLMMAAPDRPLRDEPAVRPLLAVLQALLTGELTPQVATELLTGPIGSLDAVSLRSLRRVLRQQERAAGGELHSTDLLDELLWDPDRAADLPSRHRRAPQALARVLSAGRDALAEPDATVETVLWAIWSATGLASTWQRSALRGGPGADRADADLDAVMTLFRAAEQYVDRTAGATMAGFVEHLAAQDFPADTLAARGQMDDAVAVHTPASSAGGQWQIVAVVGVQEDVWPDLRIRDSLLGSAELAEVATARHAAAVDPEAATQDPANRARRARREVADGELRSFVMACSRAQRVVYVTAVLEAEARPSVFFDLVSEGLLTAREVTRVAAPLDLRGLVAHLRSALRPVLTPGVADPDPTQTAQASEAAGVLAHLADQGVDGADPRDWGVLHQATSAAALVPPGQRITLSPSTVELATTCPLRWLLTRHGGQPGSTDAQNLGILIHDIAAAHPHGTEAEMMVALDERWDELALGSGWLARSERRRAEQMIQRLAHYNEGRPGPVRTEVPFETDLGDFRLRGRVDRVEERDEGLHIVDLKTGKSAIPVAEADHHPQLGSYQVAASAGAFGEGQNGGAALVYLGIGKQGTIRAQRPLPSAEDPQWAHAMLAETAGIISASQFEARPNKDCPRCPVRTSCPAVPDGVRVTGGGQ